MRKPSTSLIGFRQKSEETLREYAKMFNLEALQVDDLNDKICVATLIAELT